MKLKNIEKRNDADKIVEAAEKVVESHKCGGCSRAEVEELRILIEEYKERHNG